MKFRKEVPGSGSDGSKFLRLKDGETAIGVFRGDPEDFFVLWKDKQAHHVDEGTPGAKFRFRINFIVKDAKGYTAKIFEQGSTVYESLKALHAEYDLENTVIKISRHGASMNDTSYNLMPLRTPVTDEVRQVPLINLKPSPSSPVEVFVPSHTNGPDLDSLPF